MNTIAGDILHFRLRWNIFRVRIASKDASGEIWLAAADLGGELIPSGWPMTNDPIQGKLAR
jgi:hypothetical protein